MLKHWLKTFSLAEMLQGMFLTLRIMFRAKPTVRYPEERTPYSPRFRGMHALTRDDAGAEKCIGCKLCYSVCPQKCIDIKQKTVSIDQHRCLHCGRCAEICPKQTIVRRG